MVRATLGPQRRVNTYILRMNLPMKMRMTVLWKVSFERSRILKKAIEDARDSDVVWACLVALR